MIPDANFYPELLRWRWALSLSGLVAAAWQVMVLARAMNRARRLVGQARRFETHPPRAHARVLLLGDSTGVGVGSETAEETLSGLLAAEFPGIEIVNACRSGARIADTSAQLWANVRPGQPFDLALVLAGGNDVLRLTPPRGFAAQAQALLRDLLPRARQVVWLGSADIGTAPALNPPLNWVFGYVCRHRMKLLGRVVSAAGAEFIDFCSIGHSRTFTGQPQRYFAADGLHPSAASYRHCFEELKRRAPLVALLTRRPVSVVTVSQPALQPPSTALILSFSRKREKGPANACRSARAAPKNGTVDD